MSIACCVTVFLLEPVSCAAVLLDVPMCLAGICVTDAGYHQVLITAHLSFICCRMPVDEHQPSYDLRGVSDMGNHGARDGHGSHWRP